MNIFFLELRNQRRNAVTGALAIGGVILTMLAFFPSMQTQAMQELAGAKLEGIDPALLAALGLTEMMDFSVISNYFGYALQYVTLAIMVVTTQRSVSLFIREETDGTIEFLCAKPVSRCGIFCQKLLAHTGLFAWALAVYTAATVVGYLLFSDYGFGAAMREAAVFYAGILFVGLVFSAVGVLLSVLLKSGRGTAGVAIAVVFGSFILGIMAVVIKPLGFLVWLSPMDWIKPSKLLAEGIVLGEWITGIAVMAGGAAAAWLFYRKKDLLV